MRILVRELGRFTRRNTLAAIGGAVGLLIVFVNIAVDLSYAWLDPRIRY